MHDLAQLDRPAHPVLPQNILVGDIPHNVVEAAFVDRQPGIARHRDRPENLLGRGVDVERIEIDAGPHDVADGTFPKAQGLGRHRLFHRLQHPFCPPGFEQVLDVVDGNRGALLLAGPQQEENPRRRDAHQPDQRLGEPGEDLHGGGHHAGNCLGLTQGEPFWHQLPQQQRHERQKHHKHRQRNRSSRPDGGRRAVGGDPLGDMADHSVATVSRRQRAHQRDTDLHRGQKSVWIEGQLQGLGRGGVAILGQLPQPPPTAGDDRHLGPGEESVGQDQDENDEDFLQHGWGLGLRSRCRSGGHRDR